MRIYVFLDTNNWIYLANGFNIYSNRMEELHLKIFETLEKRASEGRIVFLVNDLTLEEFERNKIQTEAKIKDIQNKSTNYVNNLKPVKEFLDGEDLEHVNAIEKQIKDRAAKRIDQQREHIAKVDHFIKHSTVHIPITDQHHVEAAKMAVAKKAPFIGDKRNSMADALLMLSFIDYMRGISIYELDLTPLGEEPIEVQDFPLSYFVSSNSGDFSDPDDREQLHPDLVPLMAASKSKYHHVLHKLYKEVEQELLTDEEEAMIEDAEDWVNCKVCDHDFSRIDFFKPISLFNPHLVKGGSQDEDQLGLFEEMDILIEKPYVEVVTGECNMCNASYLECPNCGDLVVIEESNTKIDCSGCSYKFILHEIRDRKGYTEQLEYEILMSQKCINCGDEVDEINSQGFCEVCEEYESNAINN